MKGSSSELLVELYPKLIFTVLCGNNGKSINESSKTHFVSMTNKYNEVFFKICESYNFCSTKDARLWNKPSGEQNWDLVDEENADFKNGDVYMLEVKLNKSWPMDERDNEEKDTRAWRNFEVGDQLDVLHKDEWKQAQVKKVTKDKILVHYLNENYKKEEYLTKKSYKLAKLGTHTLENMFRSTQSIPKEIVGLGNLGNTCYMNSILQCLMHTPYLRNFFMSKSYVNFMHDKSSDLVEEVAKLFNSNNNNGTVRPYGLKKAINKELPEFEGFEQMDA